MNPIRKSLNRKKTMMSTNQNDSSSQRLNLRTVYKERGSCKSILSIHNKEANIEKDFCFLANNPENTKSTGRSRLSDSFPCTPQLKSFNVRPTSSISQNSFKQLQTFHHQQQLIYKPQNSKLDCSEEFNRMMAQIIDLDKKAEALILKKINKISRKSGGVTLKDKGDDEISVQIEGILKNVNDLKSEELEKLGASQRQTKMFTDKKIQLLQKLLASKSVESQFLKKHFFAISAINHQKKASTALKNTLQKSNNEVKRVLFPLKSRSKAEKMEAISNQSFNKLQFLAPKPNQYESFRYKSKQYVQNKQPFPRSSYNCQFLMYSPQKLQKSYKNLDNINTTANRKVYPSTYSKDYKKGRSERIDFKDLDSYQNKFKNISISYAIDHRKQDSSKFMQASKRYIADQSRYKYNSNLVKSITEGVEDRTINPKFNKSLIMRTQSTIQYLGEQQIHNSCIKHKNLNSLKYSYKNMGNY